MLKREDLIAPMNYNLVNEIEKFSRSGQKTALLWEDESGKQASWSYEKLMEETDKIGAALTGLGFEKGDKLIVMVPRVLEAYAVYLAILKAGMVVIPCSEMLRAKDLEYRIAHAEVKGAIVYPQFISAFKDVKSTDKLITLSIGENEAGWKDLLSIQADGSSFKTADTTREDMAFLSYTSGTTGQPKGVVHTHGWAFAHLKTSAGEWLGISENDNVWATAAPRLAKMGMEPSACGTGKRSDRICVPRKIWRREIFGAIKPLSNQCILLHADRVQADGKSGRLGNL